MNWLSFIPGSPGLWLKGAIFAAGLGIGGIAVDWWQGDTVSDLMLERAHNDLKQARAERDTIKEARAKDEQALASLSGRLVKAEQARYRPSEVANDVENQPDCIYKPIVGMRLDAAAGVPEAASQSAYADASAAFNLDLSQRRIINGYSGIAKLYDECRARHDALIERYQ